MHGTAPASNTHPLPHPVPDASCVRCAQAVGAESHIGCGQHVVLYAFENFARRMVHQFPTDPTAQVRLPFACHTFAANVMLVLHAVEI